MKIKYLVALSLLIITLLLALMKFETLVYIGNPNSSNEIDLTVSINENNIYADTAISNPFKYEVVRKRLRIGMYKLYVQSESKNIIVEKRFMIPLNKHIIIEYIPDTSDYEQDGGVLISTQIKPFYIQ